jgi:hypothetical protein
VAEQGSDSLDNSHHRMIVCVAVVDFHVVKERPHVLIEELLDNAVVEVCIDKHGPDVCFDYIW